MEQKMTKTIELIAEESGMTQYVAPNNKYLERFAELLIKECAIIASKAENNDNNHRCVYDVIVEHFGVK